MSDQDTELLELVKALSTKVDALETEIKSLKILTQNVPEETMVAIAAAVAGYLGLRARKRQMPFSTSNNWRVSTRHSQHAHTPLHMR